LNSEPGAPSMALERLNIEFASKCNLRCKWCSLDFDKPAASVDWGAFPLAAAACAQCHLIRPAPVDPMCKFLPGEMVPSPD
jgi:hypothetical protein